MQRSTSSSVIQSFTTVGRISVMAWSLLVRVAGSSHMIDQAIAQPVPDRITAMSGPCGAGDRVDVGAVILHHRDEIGLEPHRAPAPAVDQVDAQGAPGGEPDQ